MLPASTAPQFALLGSLVAHVAVATALAGMGHARSSDLPQMQTVVTFESIAPLPAAAPEPVIEPPQETPKPRITRAHVEPKARKAELNAPEPKAPEPVATAATPAPSELPVTQVATVDATASATSITVPKSASQHVGAPGVIAARAPASTQSAAKGLSAVLDRSRRASLEGGARWDCPFPNEAESEGIESAKAVLRVELDAQGQPLKVIVTDDPGYGFGREARRCAMRRRWISRLDHSGAPTADAVTVVVSFERS